MLLDLMMGKGHWRQITKMSCPKEDVIMRELLLTSHAAHLDENHHNFRQAVRKIGIRECVLVDVDMYRNTQVDPGTLPHL